MDEQVLSGKFVIKGEIASGGMGVLYRALDRTLNRDVAIKILHRHLTSDTAFTTRFLQEARAMARLNHEHIIRVYAVEEHADYHYIVMEYFPGKNLRQMLKTSTFQPSLRQSLDLILQLTRALAYAHSHGVIHRDIKPANILLNAQGKAMLTDFGIATAMDQIPITPTGYLLGSPQYMSPEQAQGRPLDPRTDLYSLGIVLYELLVGVTPLHDLPSPAVLSHLSNPFGALRLAFPEHVPPTVREMIIGLTRWEPDDRLPDAKALASRLRSLLSTSSSLAPDKIAGSLDTRETMQEVEPYTESDGPILHGSPAGQMGDAASHHSPMSTSAGTVRQPTPSEGIVAGSNNPTPHLEGIATPHKPLRPQGLLSWMATAGVFLALSISVYALYWTYEPGQSLPQNEFQQEEEQADAEPGAPQTTSTPEWVEKVPEGMRGVLIAGKKDEDSSAANAPDAISRREDMERQGAVPSAETLVAKLERPEAPESGQPQPKLSARAAGERRARERSEHNRPAQELDQRLAAEQAARERLQRELTEKESVERGGRLAASAPVRLESPGEPGTRLPTAPKQLEELLVAFRTAYESKDLGTLKRLAVLDARDSKFFQMMFSNYATIGVEISVSSVSAQEATAEVKITRLIDRNGRDVKPSPIIRSRKVQIRREGERWGKVIW